MRSSNLQARNDRRKNPKSKGHQQLDMRYEQKRVIQTVVGSYSPDLKADRLRYTKSLTLYAVCSSGTPPRKALILPMTDKLNPKPNPKRSRSIRSRKRRPTSSAGTGMRRGASHVNGWRSAVGSPPEISIRAGWSLPQGQRTLLTEFAH